MKTYQHILLATDLSPQSLPAAKAAYSLAQQYKAHLGIVHVIEDSPFIFGGELAVQINIQLDKEIESTVRMALQSLADKFKVPTERIFLRHGSVKHEVMETAKTQNVDLIIVGAHHTVGLEKLLGSQANAILHAAPCDVLVIRYD